MNRLLFSLRAPFVQRVGATRAWSLVAYSLPRPVLMLALALLSPLLLLVLAPQWPTFLDEDRVVQVVSRYVSGLVTAATMAVGFGALALRRGMKGIGELTEAADADHEFRARARHLTGRATMPVQVGEFLAVIHASMAEHAREARQGGEGALTIEGVRLDELMEAIEERARVTAEELLDARGSPPRTLAAAIDFDHDVAAHLARAFQRDDRLSARTREPLDKVVEGLVISHTATAYVKTLDMQWGLSRMVHGIAITSFIAVVTATLVGLGYRTDLGVWFLAPALFVLSLPLALFVSYAIRFVFVNEHSLPLGPFMLGPENPALALRDSTQDASARAPRGPRA